MDAYFSLFVALAYVAMTVIFVLGCLLYIFSLPAMLRVHAPLVDDPREGEEGTILKPEEKDGSNGPAVPGAMTR